MRWTRRLAALPVRSHQFDSPVSTVIVAAITSRINAKPKQPTHSFIGMVGTMKYPSVVMLEQLRTLDKCRVGPYVGSLSDEKMEDVTRALCISLAIDRKAVKGV